MASIFTELLDRKNKSTDSEEAILSMESPWPSSGPGDPNSSKSMIIKQLST